MYMVRFRLELDGEATFLVVEIALPVLTILNRRPIVFHQVNVMVNLCPGDAQPERQVLGIAGAFDADEVIDPLDTFNENVLHKTRLMVN